MLIVGLFILIFLTVPVPFAIALISCYVLKFEGTLPLYIFIQRMFNGLNSFILIAVPLFLLTGNIMNQSGITKNLINLSQALVGHIRGGLAHINIVVSMFFAGISGSSTADTAGIGSILIPAMRKRGFDIAFSVAVTASSSTLGIIIPPSIVMIVYSATTGSSVTALFLAGFIPGIIIALGLMLLSYIYAVKYNYPREKKADFKTLFIAIKESILPLVTPIIIIGGIVGGIFTATEAAVIAVVYSLFLSMVVYKTIKPRDIPKLLVDTALLSSLSLFCVSAATIFGWILGYFQIPLYLINFLENIFLTKTLLLFAIASIFLLVGTFLDGLPAIIILMPVLLPIAKSFGIPEIQLGIVVVISVAIGLITPPYGLCLLLASAIAEIPVHTTLKTTFVFIVVMILLLSIIILIPEITLFLPKIFVPQYL